MNRRWRLNLTGGVEKLVALGTELVPALVAGADGHAAPALAAQPAVLLLVRYDLHRLFVALALLAVQDFLPVLVVALLFCMV
jgi:uncharacterized membrane protein (DUF4010 family)